MNSAGPDSKRGLSVAAWCGICAFGLGALIFPFSRGLAMLPLAAYLLLCLSAPFFPGFGFFLPIISHGSCDRQGVALTFDDGPDPDSTPEILALLAKHGVKATFFVTGRRSQRYPEIVAAILSQGHTIGNHSHNHDNFVMCKSARTLRREIADAQQIFHRLGVVPLAFRPPVGITNPKLGKVLDQMGMYALNFSRRAADLGNRRIAHLARRILKGVRANDIIMLHDVKPRRAALFQPWLQEVDQIIAGIKARDLAILPLADLIGRPVMVAAGDDPGKPG